MKCLLEVSKCGGFDKSLGGRGVDRRWGSLITVLGNHRGGLGYRASPNNTVLFGVVMITLMSVSR